MGDSDKDEEDITPDSPLYDLVMTHRVASLLKLMVIRQGGEVRVNEDEWNNGLKFKLAVGSADDGTSDMVLTSIEISHKSRH